MKRHAIRFANHFAELVASGKKCSTVRRLRQADIPALGDTLEFYHAGQLDNGYLVATVGFGRCISVSEITVQKGGLITLDGRALTLIGGEVLANNDGFESLEAFIAFIERHYGLPFSGQLIEWESLDKGE
jgi:hypothetical protein